MFDIHNNIGTIEKVLSSSTQLEPTCFTQENKRKECHATIKAEINALIQHVTRTLVPKPNNVNIVGNKYMYKIK
jgi:deoxycytidylate deaminase